MASPLLQADNISKSFGSLSVFTDISLVINEGDKTAMIARNGEGKTTLLNILSGRDTADGGNITSRKDLKIGYLEQEPLLLDNIPLIDQVFASSGEVAKTIREYEEALAGGNRELMDIMTSRMDALQAWGQETKARQILTELNITEFHRHAGELSGGQRKRVALAKVLIDEPELLILDEPTNHLDLDMTEWLENLLQRSGLTILMVTHDRYFLDRVCNQIIELDNNAIFKYNGNYSHYLEKRAERLDNLQAGTVKARNLLRKEQEWMRRMPKARTGKSKSRIEAFYDLKDRASGIRESENIKIKAGSKRLGNKIIELRHISKSFGNDTVIADFSYTFSRFEKIGIIGKNGTGKSTFLNIVTKLLKPDKGTVDTGETVRFGYFKQEGISFDEKQKVIDAVRDISEVVKMKDGSVITSSQLLAHFLFPPQRQHDFISKLSGGERRRLYLVTILMQNPNFLILDEPTNDLDIETLNVLEDYLANAGICVLVVSHDRFFLDKISDSIFVFEGGGRIRNFPGNYTQYRIYSREPETDQEKQNKKATGTPEKRKQKENLKNALSAKNHRNGQTQRNKLSFNEKRELQKLERDIELLEKEKVFLEEALSGGNLSSGQLQEYSKKYADISTELEIKSDRWLELSESGE